jgi:hypothetical protein
MKRIVLDYRGGTYIAQVVAGSPSGAVALWLSKLEDKDLHQWKANRKALADITPAAKGLRKI